MSIDLLRNYGTMKDLFFIYHAVHLFLFLLLPLSLWIKLSLIHGEGLPVGQSSKRLSSLGQEAEDVDQASRKEEAKRKMFC